MRTKKQHLVDAGLIGVYLGAIIVANGIVSLWGQQALPYTAFLLIPFDLVVRDLLQDRWQYQSRNLLYGRMTAIVLLGSALSFAAAASSFRVALASFTAFAVTGGIDCITYQSMIKWGRIFRINLATIIAAGIDSTLFPWLAFGDIDWSLTGAQTLSKCIGGFVWSLVLYRFFRRGIRLDVYSY